jgi:hypothetical protein
MVLTIMEFLLRLLEHVPARGMQTARGYGLYAGNQHSGLQRAFTALGASPPQVPGRPATMSQLLEEMGLDASGNCCPVCGKPLIIEREWRPYWKSARSPPTASPTSLTPASTPA